VNNLSSYGAPQLSTKNEADMARVLETVIRQMQEVSLSRMNAMIVGDILYYVGQIAEEHDTYKQILRKVARLEKDEEKDEEKVEKKVEKKAKNKQYDMLSPAIRYPDSISLGDVMYVLGMLDSRSKCTYVRYLVEVIRIQWSIRMTEEFFVNGTTKNAENTNITYGITKDFRCAVGGSFANPDCVKDFIEDCGWMKYDEIYKYSTDLARLMILYRGSANPQEESWRGERSDGGPYYNVQKIDPNEKRGIWCNPFAAYARLLSEKKTQEDLNNGYIMALPFYSFDFMYRYYEEMHKTFRDQKHKCSFWEALAILLKDKSGVQVVVDSLELKGMPDEKKREITGSLEKANMKLRDMLQVIGTQLKADAVKALDKLCKKLGEDKELTADDQQLDDDAKKKAARKRKNDTQKLWEDLKKKIDELFVLNKNQVLSPPLDWKGEESASVYEKYNKASISTDKIEVLERIRNQLSPTSKK
jgi:hypothetical protein